MGKAMKELSDDLPYKELAEKLRALRKAKKVSREAVSVACGISSRTYVNYESGTRIPFADTACKLADYFGVSVEELLGGATTKKAETGDMTKERAKDELDALYGKKNPIHDQMHRVFDSPTVALNSGGEMPLEDQDILILEMQKILMQFAEERSKKFSGGRGKSEKYLKDVQTRKATIAEIDGKVTKIDDVSGRLKIYVKNDNEIREHLTMYGAKLKVEKGDTVNAGDQLTEGSVSPKELLAVTDPNTVQQYILKEVQKVYRSQGVDINDKHVELIAKRMISQIRIVESGDTDFVPSTTVSINEFTEGNKDVIIQGKKPAIGQPILLGITKASLQTDSFLSSASFQETTRILTEAAVKGSVDKLHGLKENVIIGKLIPAGTGAHEYMDIDYTLEKEFLDDEPSEVLEEEFME